jgi:hypothetical protein
LTITLTGREIERAYVDKGYRGHDMENPRRVFILGQKRGVFGCIKRELRRRSLRAILFALHQSFAIRPAVKSAF